MFKWLDNLFKPKYPVLLDEVNRSVNRSLLYMSDLANYGKTDVWVKNPKNKKGDCEDFALTKQDLLIQYGISPSDLALQLCFYKNFDKLIPHAVLVYKKEWVLDNRTDIIWPKKSTTYTNWIENTGNRIIYNGTNKTND